MRPSTLIPFLLFLAMPAVAAPSTTIVDVGWGKLTIYEKHHLSAATFDDGGPYIFVYGGSVGKIRGRGTMLTLGGSPHTQGGKAQLWLLQYPLVTGGSYQYFDIPQMGDKLRFVTGGTYTVVGSATSAKPH